MPNRAARVAMLLLAATLAACGGDSLDQTISGTLRTPRQVTLGNLTTVLIDPNGKEVVMTWRAYNTKSGDALHAPWEELELVAPGERHTVSDRDLPNGSLRVDQTEFGFDMERDVAIVRFGEVLATGARDATLPSRRPADVEFD